MNRPDDSDFENPFPEPFEVEITDALDLHHFSPKDVRAVVETYLAEARKRNFSVVRIIHGKGIGVQRETVRRILAETDFVESFKNAPEFMSNRGATIVKLVKSEK
ncbi:MAG TPA: Smr/MutS family protein [Pyrinomonadaceae bacterium]|nr:Smr/MutS family protein [Pyrinomonadaceae bacterium]